MLRALLAAFEPRSTLNIGGIFACLAVNVIAETQK
jgi:hypothetical protein